MRKTLIVLAMLMLLSGCDDRFRYACQDPKNWELEQCKRPICTSTRTCPEHVSPSEFKGKEPK